MARFVPDCGLLIQHVPRTGGTFVEQVLDRADFEVFHWNSKQQDPKACPKKHSLLSHYCRDKMVLVKRVACFVRHPVSYYASTWQYLHESRLSSYRRLTNIWNRWQWHPFRQAALLYRADFCEWVDVLLEQEPGWATRLMSWYAGPEHGEYCDFIGRTETIVPDLAELLGAFGHPVSMDALELIGRANASTVPKPCIPDELLARIEREERVLIRRFYSDSTLVKRWYKRPPRNRRLPAPGVA